MDSVKKVFKKSETDAVASTTETISLEKEKPSRIQGKGKRRGVKMPEGFKMNQLKKGDFLISINEDGQEEKREVMERVVKGGVIVIRTERVEEV